MELKASFYIVETKKKTIENLRARALEGKSTIISLSKEDFIKNLEKKIKVWLHLFLKETSFEISEELFIQQLKMTK